MRKRSEPSAFEPDFRLKPLFHLENEAQNEQKPLCEAPQGSSKEDDLRVSHADDVDQEAEGGQGDLADGIFRGIQMVQQAVTWQRTRETDTVYLRRTDTVYLIEKK